MRGWILRGWEWVPVVPRALSEVLRPGSERRAPSDTRQLHRAHLPIQRVRGRVHRSVPGLELENALQLQR